MVEPVRHRQTKEAETDMFDLQPPRHISTLHFATIRVTRKFGRYWRHSRPERAFSPDQLGRKWPNSGHWLCTAAMVLMPVSAPIKVLV